MLCSYHIATKRSRALQFIYMFSFLESFSYVYSKRKQESVGQQEKSHLFLECKMSSFIREDSEVEFLPQAGRRQDLHYFINLLVSVAAFFFLFKFCKHTGELILVCVKDFYECINRKVKKA